jgi:GAF domain-containing protein
MTRTMPTEADQQRIIDALRRELEARTAELAEARAERAATAEILEVINSSPANLMPVFEAILRNAHALCGVAHGSLQILEDGYVRAVAIHGIAKALADILRQPRAVAEAPTLQALLQGQRYFQVNDVRESESPLLQRTAQLQGARTLLSVPLRREGKLLGMIVCARLEVKPFAEREISLLESFATQAVLAIENARLFSETKAKTHDLEEALRYQTGSANILNVIASSPTDVNPVLKAIVESACELCEAYDAVVLLNEGDHLLSSAHHGPIPMQVRKRLISRKWTAGRAFIDRKAVHVHDLQAEQDEFPDGVEMAIAGGYHSIVSVPLLREGESIGALTLRRTELDPFSDKQIALLQTFADQAVIALGNVRLFEEVQAKTHDLEEALTYQTGSSNILRVIASSPTDVKPVLQAIVESACELCGAYDALVRLKDGDGLAFGAHHGPLPVSLESVPFTANSTAGLAMIERKPVHVHDLLSFDGDRFPDARALARSHGERTILSVPLLREDESIGAIILRRTEVNPFSDKQIALLQTFADQAVIALGNVRLFEEVQARTRDLQESLQQQTATADVLKVISRSAFDLHMVLQTLVESAARLCNADMAQITRQRDGVFFRAEAYGFPQEFIEYSRTVPIVPDSGSAIGRALLDGKASHIPDALADPDYTFNEARRIANFRAVLAVPMLRDGAPIGVIVMTRKEPRPFTEKQIDLATTFADQAAIAIGNVQLFDAVQAKTRDLQESLQQQTATADVLKVISRSAFDLQVVLDTLVESAARLCEADMSVITRQRGDTYFRAGSFGFPSEFMAYVKDLPIKPERATITGRTLLEGKVTHVRDVYDDPDYSFPEAQRLSGDPRTILGVPLLREGKPVGALALLRKNVRPFTDKQIELVTTFADQAVIAIENVRLFDEVQAKTHDLEEALRYQTGSSKILNVIASSPTDVQPVLQAIVESACELCEAHDAVVLLQDGDDLCFSAHHGPIPINTEKWPIGRGWAAGRAFVDRATVHVHDVYAEEASDFTSSRELSHRAGSTAVRSILAAPLLREGESIGAILLRRQEVRPFTDKQIAMLQTFADQAVIALGNVRLFEEVQARTRDLQESLQQQTATSEVLKVISSSPGELAPVFSSMLENAVSICDAKFGNLFLVDGDTARWEAGVGTPPKLAEFFTQSTWFRPTPGSHLARVLRTKQVSHTADDTAEAVIGVSARLGGARSTVCVPMVKDDTLVGAIFIYRTEVRPFTDKQIDLVKNFAAQAVIAIENARLLEELRQRTDDLSASLDNLRTAQDRLVQTEKLASLGQLTAGIAHEIKNPLNFVNNFAALSVELTDELNAVLKQAAIADKLRAEVDELTGFLKDNLAKVVQHGKRADSIVKNMLLHSREGSGEHRPADINALVDESLNLAYHGARAEKPQFNVTLRRNFDPEAGMVDVFPQEIIRVFLNLLSNGFYAVTKRKADDGAGFEPVVSAMTKGRIDGVEIRIRDNGTGIPPEVKEKMFNPFFTTKPAGEGTGLGLSMSYDIIVKQHGGTIDVDTMPGEFTEFTIVLPRTSLSKKN